MSLQVVLDASAIDPGFKAHAARGTGRYVAELARAFAAAEEYRSDNGQPFAVRALSLHSCLQKHPLYPVTQLSPFGKMTLSTQLLAPHQLRRLNADLVHFPAHIDAPSWSPVPTVVTVLDLIPLIFPEHYGPARYSWRFRLARYLELKAIRSASAVIAISECTKHDLVRLLGVSPDKIVVTPLGVDSKFLQVSPSRQSKSTLRKKFNLSDDAILLLYVGGIDWRKNIETLLRLTARLRSSQSRPVHLIMAGSIENDQRYASCRELIRDYSLEAQVITPGYVPDEELLELYAGADVFLFPSLYEGFGLPVVEAMAAGVPVLVADRSSLPEIVDRDDLRFDPDAPEEGHAKLERLLNDVDYASGVAEWGKKRAQIFTWSRTASLTLECYRQNIEQINSSACTKAKGR